MTESQEVIFKKTREEGLQHAKEALERSLESVEFWKEAVNYWLSEL